ncbi:MAG TPA: dihydrodipicolinate synthase family protein, partial [Thermomicrobiales bacterium]|nr:dihydrodipicolinate synthase family protein [Thermomicrobiales bacterium]
LPTRSGGTASHAPGPAPDFSPLRGEPATRVAFAAAHVVADPLADIDPTLGVAIDWDVTLAFRHHLWSLGFRVAEAMDTAQRGMGLDWGTTQELIRRSIAEARSAGGKVASGVGTDHLAPGPDRTVDDVLAAYEEQCAFVEGLGGQIVLMASRALAACAAGPEDYHRVYGHILDQVREPVILHWLGDMFDPALAGYWGSDDLESAMNTVVAIIAAHAAKVDGIKVSLLDKDAELILRRRLPEGVRLYTGDDFNFPELIRGDEQGHSDALLGVFDAIAPVARAALAALDAGDLDRYDAIFAPTVPLARHIFAAPTRFYKTGVVFLAWLNGHQDHFRMVNGQENTRSVLHLAELFRLADAAGALRDPDLAILRMRSFLEVAGVAQ